MADIMNQAEQMRVDLEESDEFLGLKTAYAAVEAEEKVAQIFHEFQNFQLDMQKKQMNGEEITEENMQRAHNLADQVSKEQLIRDLMDREKDVNNLLNKINDEITKPIRELYEG